MIGTPSTRWLPVLGALALSVTACGGDDGANTGGTPTDGAGTPMATQVEDGRAGRADEMERPDWVPDGFPLPGDLGVVAAGAEDGVEILTGTTNADPSTERARLQDWLAGAGYEIVVDELVDDDLLMTAVSPDGEVVDVTVGTGGFLLKIGRRDVSAEVQAAAEQRELAGTATITIDDRSWTVDGTCRLQGQSYMFEHFAPDGSTTANFHLDAFTQPANGTAFFMLVDGAEISQYTISVPTDGPEQPVLTAGGDGFSVTGPFLSMTGAATAPGSFSVSCDG